MPYDPYRLMQPYFQPLSKPFTAGLERGQQQAQFEDKLAVERRRLGMMEPYYESLTRAGDIRAQKGEAEIAALGQKQEQQKALQEYFRLKGISPFEFFEDDAIPHESKAIAAQLLYGMSLTRPPAEKAPTQNTYVVDAGNEIIVYDKATNQEVKRIPKGATPGQVGTEQRFQEKEKWNRLERREDFQYNFWDFVRRWEGETDEQWKERVDDNIDSWIKQAPIHGLKIKEEKTPEEKGWFGLGGKPEEKRYRISVVSPYPDPSGKDAGVSPPGSPGPSQEAGNGQQPLFVNPSTGQVIRWNEQTQKWEQLSHPTQQQGQIQQIPSQQPMTLQKQTPTVPMAQSLEQLDTMLPPPPAAGFQAMPPAWDRLKSIQERLAGFAQTTQRNQPTKLPRMGETKLTTALRIATGITDLFQLNNIAMKMKTVYKGVSEDQLAKMVVSGELLGNGEPKKAPIKIEDEETEAAKWLLNSIEASA